MSISTATRAICNRCRVEKKLLEGQRRPPGWTEYDNAQNHLCGACTKDRAEMMIAFYGNARHLVEPRVRS